MSPSASFPPPTGLGCVRPVTYRIAAMFIEREIDDAHDLLTDDARDELGEVVEWLEKMGAKPR